MNYHIDIQHASHDLSPVDDKELTRWAELTLAECCDSAELTIRLVNSEEIASLNKIYRQQDKATNVLAFPTTVPAGIELEYPLLGDVILCPSVLAVESEQLNTPLIAHWSHIVIHGVLHLLGYDHIKEEDAPIMQSLEIKLLAQLGFSNPYDAGDNNIE